MPRKKKAFGAGQDVRHFRLVTRSSHDAYANDPTAPTMVLEPVVTKGLLRSSGLSHEELLTVPDRLMKATPEAFADPDFEMRSIEQSLIDQSEEHDTLDYDLDGDCYFPKDGYNYEQHLRKCSGGKNNGMVGAVIDAVEQPDLVAIKKPAPEKQDEEEILAALNDAEAYEELDANDETAMGDFMFGNVVKPEEQIWGPTYAEMEGRRMPDTGLFGKSQLASLLEDLEWERNQETDSQVGRDRDRAIGAPSVTSVTSTRREAAIQANTAAFQDFFTNEYLDDDDIGELDDEEIEGAIELEAIEEIADEYIAEKRAERDEMISLIEPGHAKLDTVPRVIEETRALIAKHYTEEESEEETEDEEEDESKNWDCETVLSTMSNLSNHPSKIDKFKIKKPESKMKKIQEGDEDESSSEEEDVVELPEVQLHRPKGETLEEKKARKQGVKEMRAICRKMKKESKTTFKAESEKLAKKKVGGDDVRQGLRKLRIA